VVTRGIVGNGVHIHFSFQDATGTPVTHDPAGPGGLSKPAAAFAAGILKYVRALCAVTAPSIVSYERLRPHSWSAFWGNLGLRDREALLRICPVPAAEDIDPAPRFNLEFRAADAAASPYLQLGMLVYAGLQGIRDGLPAPAIHDGDPENSARRNAPSWASRTCREASKRRLMRSKPTRLRGAGWGRRSPMPISCTSAANST
jgi:glutamine synthetase